MQETTNERNKNQLYEWVEGDLRQVDKKKNKKKDAKAMYCVSNLWNSFVAR